MTKDMESLDDHDHGHLPLVVVLLHYLEEWKTSHEGKLPTSYSDKTAFRKLVTEAARRDNPEGGEENFEEAAAAVMKHITIPSLPASLKQVFDYQTKDPVSFVLSYHLVCYISRLSRKSKPAPISARTLPLDSQFRYPPTCNILDRAQSPPHTRPAHPFLHIDLFASLFSFATLYIMSSWADQKGVWMGKGAGPFARAHSTSPY
jgi:hypothetical protein